MPANGRAWLEHNDQSEESGTWTLRHRGVAKRETPGEAQARLQVVVDELESTASHVHQQRAAASLSQPSVGVSNEPRRVGMYLTVVSGVAEPQVCVCMCMYVCVCVCV